MKTLQVNQGKCKEVAKVINFTLFVEHQNRSFKYLIVMKKFKWNGVDICDISLIMCCQINVNLGNFCDPPYNVWAKNGFVSAAVAAGQRRLHL